jgi:F plasmid transfer operon, TraF, protein
MNALVQFFAVRVWPLVLVQLFLLGALLAPGVNAIDYGIYDARSLAMGGTVVAVGETSQAAYGNPALLAFHDGDEDKTLDGRVHLPSIVLQAANTIESALEAVDDNLDTELSTAITSYNADNSAANAGLVATSSAALRDVLDKIANKDLNVDAFVGVTVSEPSDRAGGAFYMGVRAIGVGTSTVTAQDLALLDEYIAATEQIAAGTPPAVIIAQHPNLIDANGQLVDPTPTLSSSATVGGLSIAEWGMALAKEFTLWGQPVSFGVTPKMMRIDAYRGNTDFQNANTTGVDAELNKFSDSKSTHAAFNIDMGVAAIIAEHYRVSLAVKDVKSRDFVTKQDPDPITGIADADIVIKLHARPRLGLAYVNNAFSVGFDYDLAESTPIANELPTQNMSLGMEYTLFDSLSLRAGYRQDKNGTRDNVMSGGFEYHLKRFVVAMAYAQSTDIKGGSLELGWTF